jgi:hypothetical protein
VFCKGDRKDRVLGLIVGEDGEELVDEDGAIGVGVEDEE